MPLLLAEHVTHRFGGLCAVSDFNLRLEPGELVGLIGPNGAGKTTVFNLITGVYRASEGRIELNGAPLVGRSPDRIARLGVSRTFQNIRLFRDLSVLDNIRIAQFAAERCSVLESLFHAGRFRAEENRVFDESMRLLSLFRLEDYASELAGVLPYGLQRRLEIARAVATNPRLLLLDEPAAGMNPNEIADLMKLIRWIRDQFSLTILLIEHQMQLVMGLCERLHVLDFGATIAAGRPEEIRNHPKVLEAYLGEPEGAKT